MARLANYHSPQLDVAVRLNTNESPYAPPAAFVDEMAEIARTTSWNRYPDRYALALRRAIATEHDVDPSCIFAANGSNEVIQTLLLALGGPDRSAAVFSPTYLLHSHIAEITRMPVNVYSRKQDFRLDRAEVDAACDAEPAVVFTCSPNNPTGTVDSDDDLRFVLDRAPGLVVVDEAYGEFAPRSAVGLAGARLVVVRTFSKVWSLAALRLGYLVGSPELVEEMFDVVLPYHLNAFTQGAGIAALRYQDERHERVLALVTERDRVYAELAADRRLETWPSGANFILFRKAEAEGSASDVWQRLVERSILVRDCSSWKDLEGCLRVTVGTPDENDRFLEALDASL